MLTRVRVVIKDNRNYCGHEALRGSRQGGRCKHHSCNFGWRGLVKMSLKIYYGTDTSSNHVMYLVTHAQSNEVAVRCRNGRGSRKTGDRPSHKPCFRGMLFLIYAVRAHSALSLLPTDLGMRGYTRQERENRHQESQYAAISFTYESVLHLAS